MRLCIIQMSPLGAKILSVSRFFRLAVSVLFKAEGLLRQQDKVWTSSWIVLGTFKGSLITTCMLLLICI